MWIPNKINWRSRDQIEVNISSTLTNFELSATIFVLKILLVSVSLQCEGNQTLYHLQKFCLGKNKRRRLALSHMAVKVHLVLMKNTPHIRQKTYCNLPSKEAWALFASVKQQRNLAEKFWGWVQRAKDRSHLRYLVKLTKTSPILKIPKRKAIRQVPIQSDRLPTLQPSTVSSNQRNHTAKCHSSYQPLGGLNIRWFVHGVGKRARTFPPDAEDTLWRHISKTFGATLFGATLFGDAAFSCDATYWRCIVWRHIVWWRHIFLWRHILAPHCLAPHCLATPHFPATPHFGATLFGATLFGDATLSCDATFWRHILWRHIVWWRHIGECYVASVGLKLVGMV